MTQPVSDATQRWDAYMLKPGGDVLRNKLGLQDSFELRQAEYRLRAVRQGEIDRGEVEIPRTFDKAHVQAIHRHLLQDVYDWAGEFRKVGISKAGKGFVPYKELDELVDKIGDKLIRNKDWSSMSRQEFVENIARVYCFQNIAHPFREGNGGSGKVYMSHVAELSPYKLDFDKVDKWEWDQASSDSYPEDPAHDPPDPTKLHAVFDKMTVEREPAAAADPELAKALALQNTAYAGIDESEQTTNGQGERPDTHTADLGAELAADRD
ncbi:Fic/DOC family protein [Kribbella sp. NPDC051586]|uniref:Fic/DOC family protein n=1 Tax=Kribbella sp. NPDC051586 TaxID=3364118 RepID=UPI00378A0E00